MAPKCVLSALVIVLSLVVTPVLAEGGSEAGPPTLYLLRTLVISDKGRDFNSASGNSTPQGRPGFLIQKLGRGRRL